MCMVTLIIAIDSSHNVYECSCTCIDAGVHVFSGTPHSLPANGLVISVGSGTRLRFFCRSDSMSANVGQLIGLDGTTALTNNSFFEIVRSQPGELMVRNRVSSQNALTTSQQGVYTCHIPLQSGQRREINVGLYPNGFNSRLLVYIKNKRSGYKDARIINFVYLQLNLALPY